MDLTLKYPRSPAESLADLVHVLRMADKARAAKEEMLGEYIYPCPLDDIILDFLGVSAETFQKEACQRSDEALLPWVESLCRRRSSQEINDINRKILDSRPDNPEKLKKFESLRNKIDPARTDIVTWVGLIDLEEGRL